VLLHPLSFVLCDSSAPLSSLLKRSPREDFSFSRTISSEKPPLHVKDVVASLDIARCLRLPQPDATRDEPRYAMRWVTDSDVYRIIDEQLRDNKYTPKDDIRRFVYDSGCAAQFYFAAFFDQFALAKIDPQAPRHHTPQRR
jgi:hypothetical protein